MSNPTHDPAEAPDGLAQRANAWRGAAVAATVLVVGALALHGDADGPSELADGAFTATQVQDTAGDVDLRCLTRRPEDCLDEPVPTDEPHEAICSTCHGLWEGEAGAVRGCTEADCHSRPVELSPFHATVDGSVLADCTDCHRVHEFRIARGGDRCDVCHRAGGAGPVASSRPVNGSEMALLGFTHDEHTTVGCASCHGAGEAHTAVRVDGLQDCRACHHEPAYDAGCMGCHELDEVVSVSFTVDRALEIRIGSLDRPVRTLPFEHALHWTNGCTACHTGGADLGTAQGADCSGCHFEHHEPTADCSVCHEPPAEGAHDRQAHLSCAGVGCHDPLPPGMDPVPRTRSVCLVCHTDREGHKPERTCSDCHQLPPPG